MLTLFSHHLRYGVATPCDPFLKKNGAGLELPISVSGTKG